MKVAILIHVHKQPDLLKRLVSRLQHPDIDIFVNLDAKSDISLFYVPNVTFIKKRENVKWGDFSQVQQILNSYSEIMVSSAGYSHILFISGQDYPIINIQHIVDTLFSNRDKSYLDHREFKNDPWFDLMRKRYEYWFFLPKNDIRNNKYIKKTLIKSGFKRKYPLTPYYGSCWMCLNIEAVRYALEYTKNNPNFVKFNKHTGCADELYFQSILLNSPLRDSFDTNIHRYLDWSAAGNSPKTLTVEDFPLIKQSDAWFARKVDPKVDSELLDMLDEHQAMK